MAGTTGSIKYESEITKELLELCKVHVWPEQKQSGENDDWQRVEVFANTRPRVLRGNEKQEADPSQPRRLGAYHFYKERVNTRTFSNAEFSYSPTHFTTRCESLEKPGMVHTGAIGFIVDGALGFHAIRAHQQVVMTRWLEVEYLRDVPIDSIVVLRVKTSFAQGRKLECYGEGVLARHAQFSTSSGPQIGDVLFKGRALFLTVDLPLLALTSAPGDFDKPFSERARKAVLDSEAYERTAIAGEIDREDRTIFFADWPQVNSLLPVVSSSQQQPFDSVKEVQWSKYKQSKNIPFDFVEDAITCTTKLRLFSATAKNKQKKLFGLASFSNQSMGPFVAHGGSVLSLFSQFAIAAVNDNTSELYPFGIVKSHIDYIKGVPIHSVVLVDDFEVAPVEKHHSDDVVEAKASIYEIPQDLTAPKKLLSKCTVILTRASALPHSKI